MAVDGMRVAVTANGPGLDSRFVPVFGRSPGFVLVDTGSLECEALVNDAVSAPGGAGIQAAQSVISKGVGAVITGQVGPNAYRVLQAAGVSVYLFSGGTVQQAVQSFKDGQLESAPAATAPGHSGLGMSDPGGTGRRMGPGGGRGRGFGSGGRTDAAP